MTADDEDDKKKKTMRQSKTRANEFFFMTVSSLQAFVNLYIISTVMLI
jgi:hypothetical protein